MKKILILAALVLVMSVATATTATAGSWIPGTPTMIEETEMSDHLERVFDHAYCQGIPRFGHKGEFPYETFVVFDCSYSRDEMYCTDGRYKSVKASRRGYWKSILLRIGSCF